MTRHFAFNVGGNQSLCANYRFWRRTPALMVGQLAIAITVIALWIVSMMALGYASSVADQIYRSALYVYASEGVAPGPYSAEMMDMAWRIKGKVEGK
jgi:hypothetical protein